MRCLLLVFLVWQIPLAAAEPVIELNAILGKQVIVTVNGQQIKLREGETRADGLKLVEVTRNKATFHWNGETHIVEPSSRIANKYQDAPQTITIDRDASGHYFVNGKINNHPALFLIDTGATSVCFSRKQADAMGINWRYGKKQTVMTASGIDEGVAVTIPLLSIGDLTIADVPGIVILTDSPGTHVLLGMSVLRLFNLRDENDKLVLTLK